jgi:hypothetical protein
MSISIAFKNLASSEFYQTKEAFLMAKKDRTRNYTAQRNYVYETQDPQSKYFGLTEDEWREKILEEWSLDNLKANHITIIFHDKCKDDGGILKPLHVHACINFKDSLTPTEAIARTGCSSEKNCEMITKKSSAYRYLLHITEKAIASGKHIYSEDELIILVTDEKKDKYDFHKLIKTSEEDEDAQKNKELLKDTLLMIQSGCYGNFAEDVDGNRKELVLQNVLLDEDVNRLLTLQRSAKADVLNAIEIMLKTNAAKKKQGVKGA